ncbi:amidohydrolase family protein [Parasedimentitalea psychrophila]|uniref:Amidohydrolase family protein n=1 Tax=Parasedimentitalea psychrophila TaxID=2997337 RepID=A0A9Y2L4H9_9RHOB|nr:amidohydrolase family protein [Parasedimentitalea psychrophila]WIY27447.1 amidohydrolase family protein [Parasedimentitalea psychrophila]
MSDIRITNCHIHTFTSQHVPRDFPFPAVRFLRKDPGLVKKLAWALRMLGQEHLSDQLRRLHQFMIQGALPSQAQILSDVVSHYPDDTRFVVLPMDMQQIGRGPVPVGLKDQHDELARLRDAANPPGSILPFATVDPRDEASVQECLRAINELGFRGLKIYPRLGFAPDHPALMQRIYPRVAELGLPVMTHCSRGGVQGKDTCDYTGDGFTRPYAYRSVLHQFPQLRLCLAHFGGQADWTAYLNAGETRGRENWMEQIRDMIGGGQYANLWTDISYTLFQFEDFAPILRLLLSGEQDASQRLRRRVLFGSDFYMTRQEELSERAVSIRLRVALGETLFSQIAQINPEVWLDERAEDKTLWTGQG